MFGSSRAFWWAPVLILVGACQLAFADPERRYREMSRLFLLIDPIYVSDDIVTHRATRPEHRFNHVNLDGSVQPAWENFNRAYDELQRSLAADAEADMAVKGFALHQTLLRGNVDGTPEYQLFSGATREWSRDSHRISFPLPLPPGLEAHLGRFFVVLSRGPGQVTFAFRSEASLAASLPGLGRGTGGPFADALMRYIAAEVRSEADPLKRAAKILYLVPRLHPYANGNGRFARLWASVEVERAGLAPLAGLPTNDFPLSEAELLLEVRRAAALGRMWQSMISEAKARGIPPDRFFQEVYRGSALEGLILHRPDPAEGGMEKHLRLLENLAQNRGRIPEDVAAWARAYATLVHEELPAFRASSSGNLAHASELERHRFLVALSEISPPPARQSGGAALVRPCLVRFALAGLRWLRFGGAR